MRTAAFVLAALLLGGPCAAGPETGPQDGTMDLSQAASLVDAAEGNVEALDALIAGREIALDDLYLQRDAAADRNEPGRVAQLDRVIDKLNLTLTQLEAERDAIAGQVATLKKLIAQLRSETASEDGE